MTYTPGPPACVRPSHATDPMYDAKENAEAIPHWKNPSGRAANGNVGSPALYQTSPVLSPKRYTSPRATIMAIHGSDAEVRCATFRALQVVPSRESEMRHVEVPALSEIKKPSICPTCVEPLERGVLKTLVLSVKRYPLPPLLTRSSLPASPLVSKVAGLPSTATVPMAVSTPAEEISESVFPNTANSRPSCAKMPRPLGCVIVAKVENPGVGRRAERTFPPCWTLAGNRLTHRSPAMTRLWVS